MDEVPLTFDVPSNKTVDFKGAKAIMIKTSGNEKTRYTVVLACFAGGTKLPPLLIFKRKMLPKDVIQRGIYIQVETIVKSLKKCGISNALDGSEDDILYEESDALSENNHEDDFSGSEDDFVGFYDE